MKQPCQCLRTLHAIQQPERVCEFDAEFVGGEGELLLRRKGFKKLSHVLLIDKLSAFGFEKLVQVEGIFRVAFLVVKVDALLQLVAHDVTHSVGEQAQARHVLVRVAVEAVPRLFGFLLLGVTPVEDLLLRKLSAGNGLERCAREVEGEVALNVVEGAVRAPRIDTLMGFVDDK